MAPFRTLGPYDLVDRLAVGGMAEIYLARSRGVQGFEKEYVLKLIHPKYVGDSEFIRMLVDEAKLVAQLDHSNIAQVIDLGVDGESYYILMEYVRGQDLYQILQTAWDEDLRLPIPMCVSIAMGMCAGLDYAHNKKDENGRPLNIVHRDISPQNVIVSYHGEAKILDFGVAKAALGARPETRAGIIKGKFRYMSPEQAWGEKLDGRSDLFSVGLCLYEMLTGTTAYEDDGNMQKTLQRMRDASFTPPSEHRPQIDSQLENTLMKALARQRHERYSSCHDFEVALAEYLHRTFPGFTRADIVPVMAHLFPDDTKLLHIPSPTKQTVAGIRTADTAELDEMGFEEIEDVTDTDDVTLRQSILRGEPAGGAPDPDDSFAGEATELYLHQDEEPTALELPGPRLHPMDSGRQPVQDPHMQTSDMAPEHLQELLVDELETQHEERFRPNRTPDRPPFVTPSPSPPSFGRSDRTTNDRQHQPRQHDARRDTVSNFIQKYLPPEASGKALDLHERFVALLESEQGRKFLAPALGILLGMFVFLILLLILI